MNEVEVIVIGNSISNLMCSALLAKKGVSIKYVQVEDKNPVIGYFPEENGTFPTCEFSYDYGNGLFARLLEELGLLEKVSYQEEPVSLHYTLGKREISCNLDWNDYKEMLFREFTFEQEGLTEYFSTIEKLDKEWMLMVLSEQMPSFTKILNIAKYSKVEYGSYIRKLFADKELIDILEQDEVVENTSLVVMAGYIMQRFQGKTIQGGYEEGLVNNLYEIIGKPNRIKIPQNAVSYEYDGEKKKYIINLGQKQYISDKLLMSRDFLEKFYQEEEKEQIALHTLYVNVKLVQGENSGKHIYKEHVRKEASLSYASEYAQVENNVQARIHLKTPLEQSKVQKLVEMELQRIQEKFGDILEWDLCSQEDLERELDWNKGQMDAWSFTPEEFKENPLTKRLHPSGFYLTEQWGRAFMTAAKVVEKNLLKDRKELEG